MKILFIHKNTTVKPLGIMYLAAACKKAGHEVRATCSSPLGEFITFKPDIVAYSIMTGTQNEFFEIDRKLQQERKHPTVWGGPHPTFFPEMGDSYSILRGEGEETLPKFLDGYETPEIGFVDNIDSIPWPDRSVCHHGKVQYFIASRGCPFNCSYCYNEQWAKLHGKKRVRYRDPIDVAEEIKSVNPEFVHFQDDSFGIRQDWLESFVRAYPGIPFHCNIRANTVTENMIKLLKQAGVYSVRFAYETANENLRNNVLNRGMSQVEVDRCVSLLRKYDIPFMVQNIIGIPDGSIFDDLVTLDANMNWNPDYAWCSIYQPYPGTELAQRCIESGLYDGKFEELGPSFFDQSYLNFDDRYKEQLKVLQKSFGALVKGKYSDHFAEAFTDYKKDSERKLFGFSLEG